MVSDLSFYLSEKFGEGAGPILMDFVNCSGSELRLWNRCNHYTHYHGCNHSGDVGVCCQPGITLCLTSITNFSNFFNDIYSCRRVIYSTIMSFTIIIVIDSNIRILYSNYKLLLRLLESFYSMARQIDIKLMYR